MNLQLLKDLQNLTILFWVRQNAQSIKPHGLTSHNEAQRYEGACQFRCESPSQNTPYNLSCTVLVASNDSLIRRRILRNSLAPLAHIRVTQCHPQGTIHIHTHLDTFNHIYLTNLSVANMLTCTFRSTVKTTLPPCRNIAWNLIRKFNETVASL